MTSVVVYAAFVVSAAASVLLLLTEKDLVVSSSTASSLLAFSAVAALVGEAVEVEIGFVDRDKNVDVVGIVVAGEDDAVSKGVELWVMNSYTYVVAAAAAAVDKHSAAVAFQLSDENCTFAADMSPSVVVAGAGASAHHQHHHHHI